MFKYRTQIYGGKEADEYRNKQAQFEENLRDNEIAEGDLVEKVRALTQAFYDNPNPTTKKALEDYIQNLRDAGHSRARVESILTRGTAGVTIPSTKTTNPPSTRTLRRQQRKNQ